LESRVVRLILVALALGVAATSAAYALRLFTLGGALAALLVGAAVLVAGGWGLAVVLVGAFAGSAILTGYRRSEKSQPEHRRGRSASQVLANGVVPAALAVAGALLDLPWALPAAVGAIAATSADTWATEVGLLSSLPPRLITTGEVVARGRSGGITALGSASGVAGALTAATLGWTLLGPAVPVMVVTLGGVVAFVVDSLLGATVQAIYRCPACGAEGEGAVCTCGTTRLHAGGWRLMSNDTVNVVGAAVGAAVAAFLA
jgi:uncharacterized protein (TIGR00297 family)